VDSRQVQIAERYVAEVDPLQAAGPEAANPRDELSRALRERRFESSALRVCARCLKRRFAT
jgi:hypothetical protein